MGYSTEFKGKLTFKNELKGSELAKVKEYLGIDCRYHPELSKYGDLTYIDLRFTDDFSGLQWDGSEKTHDLDIKINLIISEMKLINPKFELVGKLLAQGEDIKDRYYIEMIKNVATVTKIVVKGKKIKCPHCECEFILEK